MNGSRILDLFPHSRIEGGGRIAYIDLIKGLLFIFVCLGHYTFLPEWLRSVSTYMLIFRMPAYFFLSGMLFSDRRHDTLKKYVASKSKSLLLPYIALSLLFTLCDNNLWESPSETFLANLNWIFILGNGVPKAVALWFVLTLYFASIIYYAINRHIKCAHQKLLIALVLSAVGYMLCHYQINSPWKIGTVCAAIVFFSAGHAAAKLKNISFDASFRLIALILLLFGISISCSHYCIVNDCIPNMGLNVLPSYFIFYIGAFSGTFGIIFLFNIIGKQDTMSSRILRFIARNALIILASHIYLILVLTHLCRVLLTDDPTLSFLFVTGFLIPSEIATIYLFNRYLYFLLGKKRTPFSESLSLGA